jgi:hypothetical protein
MQLDEDMIQKVWQKGRGAADRAAAEWRTDECGAWMHRAQYGNADSEYGWKIQNVSAGAANTVENLRPFHKANSFDVANRKPHCHVTADRAGLAPTQHVGTPRNRNV